MRLGVDFGTTRSVVAYCDRGNFPVLSFVTESGDAFDGYPSVVAERQGELRFGLDAVAVSSDPAWSLLRSFKRVLGESDATPDAVVRIGGTSLPVADLLTRFLSSLLSAIVERSNLPPSLRSGEPLAVVATPANAHGTQRFLTLDAFRRAGFSVLSTLNEPSAAGFEYAHRHRATITSKREHIVVYDLGGGTFDASLVKMTGRAHDAVTTAGLHQLGGDDFDDALVALVLEAAKLDRGTLPARALASLRDQCRDAKERLNPSSKRIVVDLDHTLAKAPIAPVTITTSAYYEAVAPLVERTIEAMRPVMARLDRETADEDAGFAEIAGIYVVGGASSLPIVGRMLRERFGRRVHRSPYPSAATAVGLAIAADAEPTFEITDRFSRLFGVFREASAGRDVVFDPIFQRDDAVPSARSAVVARERTYRAAHDVGHYRFLECADVDAGGSPKGDLTLFPDVFFPFDPSLREQGDLRSVPVRRLGRGPLVRERYALDEHGVVTLTITDVESGYSRAYTMGGPRAA